MKTQCTLCDKPAVGRGLCSSHYYGAKRAGTLEQVAPKNLGPCAYCGKPLQADRLYGSRFCDADCKEGFRVGVKAIDLRVRRAGRTCIRCGNEIPVTSSTKAQTCSKSCSVAWRNEKRQADRRAAWEATDPTCARCGKRIADRQIGSKFCSPACKRAAASARWRERSPGYMRQYLYGITPEQYDALLASQDNRCAICRSEGSGPKGWHVDHDHVTGTVRGLLCGPCNLGLGHFNDDVDRLRAAIAYIT